MSEMQHYPSPDGRFVVIAGSYEVRMSHWINRATLYRVEPNAELLEFGDAWWSTDSFEWSEDSRRMRVGMRHYPGDGLPITLDVLPDEAVAVPHAPADTTPIPFASLNAFLDRFYQQHRRR
jgi:hypothetical protein